MPARAPIRRQYEIVILVHPDVPESGQTKLRETVADRLSGFEGEELRWETWGKRRLAYEINKENKATYLYLNFISLQAGVNELERTLRISDSVLKFQTIVLSETIDELDLEAERNRKTPLYMSPEDVAAAERSYRREREWAAAAASSAIEGRAEAPAAVEAPAAAEEAPAAEEAAPAAAEEAPAAAEEAPAAEETTKEEE